MPVRGMFTWKDNVMKAVSPSLLVYLTGQGCIPYGRGAKGHAGHKGLGLLGIRCLLEKSQCR